VHKRLSGLLVAALVLLPAAARAQFGPAIDEKTTVVAELVVRAYGGPPWWKVSDKDTTIYVLASPGQLPSGVTFDQRLLEKRIKGANEIIMPPRMAAGPGLLFAAPRGLALFKRLNEGTRSDLEPSLPPAVRTRFAAARTRIGQAERRYGSLGPGLAGMALAGDAAFYLQAHAPAEIPGVAIEAIVTGLARKHRVRTNAARTYGGRTLGQFIGDLQKPGLLCLTSVLDRLEKPARSEDPSERRDVIQAWAEGDVRPLLNRVRSGRGEAAVSLNVVKGSQTAHILISTPECLDAVPVAARIKAGYIDDQVAALERALGRPGHAVAVLDAGSLLVTGGVLDQLQRKGFTVKTPEVD
jgi:hypothetical protein